MEAIQYFMGSFQLLNETYHSHYNDLTSDFFKREAEKLENMVGFILFLTMSNILSVTRAEVSQSFCWPF